MKIETTPNILAPLAALSLPDAASTTQRAKGALDMVRDFVIDSAEMYALAADELKAMKARAEKLEEQRTSITKPINEALRAVNALFRGPSDYLAEAEKILKNKMLAWNAEQERIAAEERRRAEEAAAAERRKLEEAAAQAKRAAEEAAAQATAGDVLAAARAAEAQATAASLTTAAQDVTAPAVQAKTTKVAGVSTATSFDFEVFDLLALVKHIAEHPELISLVQADSVRIRAQVRALQANTNLPGVRVFEKKTLRA